jgi:exopolysaccharide biosynthesis WecB/TagA/CpsF family protein
MIKVSIITPTYNSEKTIEDNIKSISNQTYKNIEHIIVDNFSSDSTTQLIEKNKGRNLKFFQKKTNIYEAMNYGIKKSTGAIIGIIGSDDLLQNKNTIKEIVEKFNNNNLNIYTGGVVFFKENNYNKIVRKYCLNFFNISDFKRGLMPPHPSTFIKKNVYTKYGYYKTKYQIAADFEFFHRVFRKDNSFLVENKPVIRMRMGGVSTRGVSSFIKISDEIFNILKIKKIKTSKLKIYLRFFYKIKQILFFDQKEINKNFDISIYKKIKDKKNKIQFRLMTNINKLFYFDNFILVALNLAFLGSWVKFKDLLSEKLIFWPDGLFSKILKKNINKIPGREIINNIKINNDIKKIFILGKQNKKNLNYLKNKFNKKIIININLPFDTWKNIYNSLPKNIKTNIKKNELIIITLPTPKQELLALKLANNNKNYKIICIGGSLNIVSGEEKVTPKLMYKYNLEFIWRLRFDSYRRFKRLLYTSFYFILGLITSKYKNIKIIIIK